MQERNAPDVADDDCADPVISLAAIIGRLWRSRWLMLAIIAAFAAVGLVKSLYLVSYKSEGFFHFGTPIPPRDSLDVNIDGERAAGIEFADYKRFAASYESFERFSQWVRENKLEGIDAINPLLYMFASGDSIAEVIQPVLPVTKLDVKQLVDQPRNVSNVIGLRITVEDPSPARAQQMVNLLGRYVMDSIIYFIYSATAQSARSENKTKLLKYENVIIENMERLAEYRRKSEALRAIVKRHPETAVLASRQVITVTEENARYLPPVTLLATTEVQELEAREAILKAKRDQAKSALLVEYYERVISLIDGTRSGETILRNLGRVKEEVFKDKNLENEIIKEVHNSITITDQVATNAYLENSRFISGPTLPARSTARPLRTLAISLMVGVVCAVLVAFARQWWVSNRTAILQPKT